MTSLRIHIFQPHCCIVRQWKIFRSSSGVSVCFSGTPCNPKGATGRSWTSGFAHWAPGKSGRGVVSLTDWGGIFPQPLSAKGEDCHSYWKKQQKTKHSWSLTHTQIKSVVVEPWGEWLNQICVMVLNVKWIVFLLKIKSLWTQLL